MATNDLQLKQGTSVTWLSTGGSAVLDHGGTFADGEAYMGAELDLGATFDAAFAVYATIDTGGTAPTAGNIIEFRVTTSYDGTLWGGGVTGSAAQYKSGEEDEWASGLDPLGVIVCTNDANTNITQLINPTWVPSGRYVVPVVINRSGQTLGAAADFELRLTPLIYHPEA